MVPYNIGGGILANNFQTVFERTFLWFCKEMGGSELFELAIRELQKPGQRPTPPRVYEFPEYLVIDRPFSFTDTDFVYGGLTSGESLQLSLSCEEKGDHYRVLACVTQGGVARSKVLIVGTCIGGREYLKGKTNPQGKRVFSIASKEESDSLIVAMVVPSKEKSTSLQGTSTRAQKVLVELHSAQ